MDMDWVQITSAIFLAAMIVFLFPRMLRATKDAPKGSAQDWLGAAIPIGAVILFVILLIMLV